MNNFSFRTDYRQIIIYYNCAVIAFVRRDENEVPVCTFYGNKVALNFKELKQLSKIVKDQAKSLS